MHPGLARLSGPANVLVLGGGDGIAVREVLKYPSVTNVTLVDLDPEMTHLFSTQELLLRINESALLSTRVHVTNADAFIWLNRIRTGMILSSRIFRIHRTSRWANFLPRLFTRMCIPRCVRMGRWWCNARHHGSPEIFLVRERDIARERISVTEPYHLYVPSFGEWGFILASEEPSPRTFSFQWIEIPQ